MVARAGELDTLTGLHAATRADGADGTVVLVEGEVGIGKTRLVEELTVALRATGAVVLRGQAYPDESHLPYRPVIDLLAERVREDSRWLEAVDDATLAEAARLVPALARALPPGRRLPAPSADGPGAETRFLTSVWDTVVAALDGAVPGALVLDDAQWADEATMRLIALGLHRLARRTLLLVLVWRTPGDHPVRSAARLAGTTVTLGRLDEDSVGEVVAAARPDGVDAETVHRYWSLSEGVPLILVQYLHAAGSEEQVPSGVREALAARLTALGQTARQVLSAAAVLGRSFDVETVRAVSGRTEEETVAALEELLARGLVREGEADYDFDHALLRTVVHDDTSLARLRLLHARAADLPGVSAAARAHHLRHAGRDEDAASAFRVAGDDARRVFAHAEALAHYRAALELGHPDRFGLLTAIADLQVLLGDYTGALATLHDAVAVATSAQRADVELRLGRLQARRGEVARADEHFASALELLEDTAARAEVVADRALAAMAAREPDQQDGASALAEEAAALAEQSGDAYASCRALHVRGLVAAAEGDLDLALDQQQRCLELARGLGDQGLEVAALNNLALAHRERGELDVAADLTQVALETCARQGDRHREAALHNNLADLLHAQGRGEEAMDHLKQAVEIFAEIGDRDELRPAIWQLVRW